MKKNIYGGLFIVMGLYAHASLPPGFCNIKDSIPAIHIELKYAGCDNFVGRPLVGYASLNALISQKAAAALKKVESELNLQGLGLKVFDAYRPQRTVDYFQFWAKDTKDTLGKHRFYPHIAKKDLHRLGYIGSRSGHSRGSTVDVTIIYLATQEELDMGSIFDYFDDISHFDSPKVSKLQKENRKFLREVMQCHGFKAINDEWWHFTLKNEPFPNTYFDFEIQ